MSINEEVASVLILRVDWDQFERVDLELQKTYTEELLSIGILTRATDNTFYVVDGDNRVRYPSNSILKGQRLSFIKEEDAIDFALYLGKREDIDLSVVYVDRRDMVKDGHLVSRQRVCG